MPYGMGSNASSKAVYSYNPFGMYYHQGYAYNNTATSTWYRSGSDRNASLLKSTRPKLYKFEKKLVFRWLRYQSTRWDKSLKRYVPYVKRVKYQVIKIYKKRVKSGPLSQKDKSKLVPNTLTYDSFELSTFGSTDLRASYPGYEYARGFSGSIADWDAIPKWPCDPLTYNGNSVGYLYDYHTDSLQRLSNTTLSKLLGKIKAQDVNIAQAFAERKQTISMIAGVAQRIASSLLAAKRGNLVGAFRKLFPSNSKNVANDWLQYQYGVKPLLSDIDGLAKYLAGLKNSDLCFDIIATDKEVVPFTRTQGTNYGWSGSSTMSGTCTNIVKYKCRIQVQDQSLKNLKVLGLTNPASLAWEVIPFSFIADWFLPIGNYLNSLDSMLGVEVVNCTKTQYSVYNVNCTTTIGGTDRAGFTWETANYGWNARKVICTRSDVSTSGIKMPLPRLDSDPLRNSRFLNAIALLRQLKR